MPWSIRRDDRCPASRPFGVVKADGELEGCHSTEAAARRQQAALYASEPGAKALMAKLSAAEINDLPDSDFLYIEPGGEKDADGRTVPRSKRHFPVPDIEHVRNALARIPQSDLPAEVKAAATRKAQAMLRRMGGEPGEKTLELDEEEPELGWKAAPAVEFALDGDREGDVLVAFAKLGVVDRERHITEPGAFAGAGPVPISSYGHTSWPEKGARLPVGRGEIAEDGDLAKLRGRFFVETAHGKDTYLTVKALGDLQEWSYGYRIREREKSRDAAGPILRLKRLQVYEVSPTLVGAGIETRTLAIKSLHDEGPLAGLPFAEEVERVLLAAGSIVARAKSLRELRVKEGRELSEANRARLYRLRDTIAALEETKAEVEELLARTERGEPAANTAGLRLLAEHERTRALLLGVPIPTIGGS